MLAAPSSSSRLRAASSWRCSVNETYWSRAFLLTWANYHGEGGTRALNVSQREPERVRMMGQHQMGSSESTQEESEAVAFGNHLPPP